MTSWVCKWRTASMRLKEECKDHWRLNRIPAEFCQYVKSTKSVSTGYLIRTSLLSPHMRSKPRTSSLCFPRYMTLNPTRGNYRKRSRAYNSRKGYWPDPKRISRSYQSQLNKHQTDFRRINKGTVEDQYSSLWQRGCANFSRDATLLTAPDAKGLFENKRPRSRQ